jgi:hypothetical protein
VREQALARGHAQIEHPSEALRPAVVRIRHLRVAERERVERAEQLDLRPIRLVARERLVSSMPRRAASCRARLSASSPLCQAPVPALSIAICSRSPASATSLANTPSAVGERQMLPRHTKQIETRGLGMMG